MNRIKGNGFAPEGELPAQAQGENIDIDRDELVTLARYFGEHVGDGGPDDVLTFEPECIITLGFVDCPRVECSFVIGEGDHGR